MDPKPTIDEDGSCYARAYDQSVSCWRGEVEFYKELVGKAFAREQDVMELACGTGRITLEDQCACLECIRRHLPPDGVLAIHLDHQDVDWLG
jgi:ubiquinone/menaquinone biosynthesis C-methylase UbiE